MDGTRSCGKIGKKVMSQSTLPAQEQTVRINGADLYYKVYGQGSPLVLLHGFFGTNEFWDPYINEFAKEYRLIVPDLRGHGRSTNPGNEFTHRQVSLDIYALLDHLEIDQFRGIGFSSGGMTLIHMATQQPTRVEAMILIGATIYYPEEARAIHREMTMENMELQFLDILRKWHKRGDNQIRSLVNLFYSFKDSHDDMNFTPAHLSTIKARTLIVHGDRDEFFPVSIPLEMYRSIPRSFLWIVPNAGHVLFFEAFSGSAPGGELFTKVALDFLQGEWEDNQ